MHSFILSLSHLYIVINNTSMGTLKSALIFLRYRLQTTPLKLKFYILNLNKFREASYYIDKNINFTDRGKI